MYYPEIGEFPPTEEAFAHQWDWNYNRCPGCRRAKYKAEKEE